MFDTYAWSSALLGQLGKTCKRCIHEHMRRRIARSIPDVTQILQHARPLMFFNIQNPTGHYRLIRGMRRSVMGFDASARLFPTLRARARGDSLVQRRTTVHKFRGVMNLSAAVVEISHMA